MIQRGSDTSFTNLWSLLLYRNELFLSISDLSQSTNTSLLTSGSETLSYADNCFIYNIAENSKRVKRNEEQACVCVCMDAG
jgi:hypothetical protein